MCKDCRADPDFWTEANGHEGWPLRPQRPSQKKRAKKRARATPGSDELPAEVRVQATRAKAPTRAKTAAAAKDRPPPKNDSAAEADDPLTLALREFLSSDPPESTKKWTQLALAKQCRVDLPVHPRRIRTTFRRRRCP